MIQAPPGERGRGTNVHECLGFKNEDILSLQGLPTGSGASIW